jgi:hypothetical protein
MTASVGLRRSWRPPYWKGSIPARRKRSLRLNGHKSEALCANATTQRGEHVAFSIMTNTDTMPAKKALDTVDQVVEKMVEDKK